MVGRVRPSGADGRWTIDDRRDDPSSIVHRPSSSFTFRDINPSDKEEILALTANTWEGGDYVEWVFDDWVNDPGGRFLAAIDDASGRIAGIDKLTFLSPTEAWFEGLRVHPDFRGRGLATRLQTHMIGEAQRLGAQTVRLLTNIDNLSMHRKAYRDGFSARAVVRHWRWLASEAVAQGDDQLWQLREATPDEASKLYEWWRLSASCRASDSLINRNWSFGATSPDEWVGHAERGGLLIPEGTDVAALALPPPLALVIRGAHDDEDPYWTISLLSATGAEWNVLADALLRWARSRGIAEVEGLVPDSASTYLALQQAGFKTGGVHASLCLFELKFEPTPGTETPDIR